MKEGTKTIRGSTLRLHSGKREEHQDRLVSADPLTLGHDDLKTVAAIASSLSVSIVVVVYDPLTPSPGP